MSNSASVIHSDPEILGGTPVFVGTRVPLRNLIDYIEESVSREQVVTALEAAHEAPTGGASPAR